MSKTVFLIVGTGRSGSSFLASLLANCGANFDMPVVEKWYRGSGAYEHPEYMKMMKHVKRHVFFKKFSDRLSRNEKKKAVTLAKEIFKKVSFVKYPPFSEYVAHIVKEAGFQPRLILTCRKFDDYMKSSMIKNGGTFTLYKDTYLKLNQTCFSQLFIYGGCIVTYEETSDINEEGWAKRLEELCNISSADLLGQRAENIKTFQAVNALPEIDKEVNYLYDLIVENKSRVFYPEQKKLH